MPVLSRSALESSPLADLHALATELGLDGFRRLRKADLVDAILARQGGEEDGGADATESDADEKPKRRARGGRSRSRRPRDADEDDVPADDHDAALDAIADAEAEEDDVDELEPDADPEPRPARSRGRRGGRDRDRGERSERGDRDRGDRGERGGRDRGGDRDRNGASDEPDRIVEGVVELLGNGSGFLRVAPPEPSDEDVYISAAQVRRCELVSGDRVSGPMRKPRRSERYPSLVRIDTINGSPAEEVAEGTHFDDLPATFPTERFALGDDATMKAVEWLTPIGKGSRVVISGAPHSGKSEALKRLATALHGTEGLEVTVVLTGVRPEEASEWKGGEIEPVAALTFASSADAQAQALDRAMETAKRIAARGGDAVVLVDSLDGLQPSSARKALAAARNIVDSGSLTVIATASQPHGGETTVIALDEALTRTGRLPALDLVKSGTLRPELLVGEAGAEAIARARAEALGA